MNNLPRPVISIIGLGIGFLLYSLAGRLGQPWETVALSGLFVGLGVAAWVYAAGERWIQVLGALLVAWGILRAFLALSA